MRCCLLIAFSVGGAVNAAAGPVSVQSDRFSAQLERGALTSLRDAQANVFVGGEALEPGLAIRRVGGDHWAQDDAAAATLKGEETVAQTYSQFSDLAGASVRAAYGLDQASGDLIAIQEAKSPEPGVWGVEWEVGYIPLDMNILVPGNSGLRLSADSPGNQWSFEYPIGWEAQLVVIEGKGRGFYIFADDAQGRFKRLTVTRSQRGWQLGLATINYAPFDPLTECNSVAWRVNVYEGDWRVPARRYRDWMATNLRPTPVADQQPAWVKDIRCVVIMGMEITAIEALAKRLDPRQTLLYIPGWRKPGYDRDYPNYSDAVPEWEPFVKRAHELGYRVMPHVNYFGVDPLNELYTQFEPYQVRSPWGNHDKQWWLWERADPVIKFAYINPAHKPFREMFVARMKELCGRYQVDALHLDQTLCLFNDNNGLIDGMSMLQGSLALHRDLREALPNVAISGEGLDEITCVLPRHGAPDLVIPTAALHDHLRLPGLRAADQRADVRRVERGLRALGRDPHFEAEPRPDRGPDRLQPPALRRGEGLAGPEARPRHGWRLAGGDRVPVPHGLRRTRGADGRPSADVGRP
jgi:hypothetical protein